MTFDQTAALDLTAAPAARRAASYRPAFMLSASTSILNRATAGAEFVQADALEYLATDDLSRFAFIWASPPCQRFTSMKNAPNAKGDEHPDLVAPTREALRRIGKPYVLENVPKAPLIDHVTLCGSMFDLQAPDGAELRRHRPFETSFPVTAPRCAHGCGPVIGVYGAHVRDRRREKGSNHRSGSNRPWEHAFIAMGVPVGSMTLTELSEAIPPAFSRFIAKAWLRTLIKEKEAPL